MIGWDRWSGGTTDGASGASGGLTTPVNGGGGKIWGTISTNAPSTGTASYDLLGATAPVLKDGTMTPGTVKSASLAVQFDTRKVGFTAALNFRSTDYTLASTGGTAAPSMPLDSLNQFGGSFGAYLVGGTCSGTTCNARVTGFLAGPAASHVGLAYDVVGGATALAVNGTIAFAKAGTVAFSSAQRVPGEFSVLASNTTSLQSATTVVAADGHATSIAGKSTAGTVDQENGSIANLIGWTRQTGNFDGGTAGPNGGYHSVWGTASYQLPTTGTATFSLAGWTAPTDGTHDPGVVRSAAMAVDFAKLTVGFTARVGINSIDYTVASNGGIAAPSLSLSSDGLFNSQSGQVFALGGTCTGTLCGGGVRGFLSGSQGAAAGIYYTFAETPGGASAVATLAFTRDGTAVAPISKTGQSFRTYGSVSAGSISNATILATSDGKLDSYGSATGAATTRGTNTDRENGGVAGVIGWTRWAGGTTGGAQGVAIPANGGGGFIWGSPATAIPTTGSATYSLLGTTAVTANDGSLTPGTVKSASLGVNFATSKVGLDATIGIGGTDYALATTGGAAAPGLAYDTLGAFLGTGTVAGNGCSGTACSSRISGFLAGAGASHAGTAFTFQTAPMGGTQVSGVIAFAKGP